MLQPGEDGKEEGAEARPGGCRKRRDSGRDRNQKGQDALLHRAVPQAGTCQVLYERI